MTLNKDQAAHDNEQLHDEATQAEIVAILASDGPQGCGRIASKIGKHPTETRWHLTELQSRCEVNYNWVSGAYSI